MTGLVGGEVATLPLALNDYVPVLLAGVGALLLAQLVARAAPNRAGAARFGAVLVLAGGLCKATWKLILASAGHDVAWVADLLFVLLAPGFALLAWALLAVREREVPAWVPGLVIVVLAVAAVGLGSMGPLLALTVVGSTSTAVLAILLARSTEDRVAMALFAVQITMAYALVPLAGTGQSISHQWWEQSLNTLGQGAFALAAFRLVRPTLVRSTA